jgi:outer membrane lipoprotein SlyB
MAQTANIPIAHGRGGRVAMAIGLLAAFTLAGCASGPKPILYPNEKLKTVGQAQADQDIADCRKMASNAGASAGSGKAGQAAGSTAAGGAIGGATGAVGGAILGSAGTGAAVGAATGATAGLLRSMFSGGGGPSQAYKNFVDHCLRERGYDPVGWQ